MAFRSYGQTGDAGRPGGQSAASSGRRPAGQAGGVGGLWTRFAPTFSRSAEAGPARKPRFVLRGKRGDGVGVRGAEGGGAEIGIARPAGAARLHRHE